MGSPECFYRARPAANFKTTGAGERSARVRYLPTPALTGSIPLAKNTDAPTQGRGSPSCKQHFVLRTTSSDSLMKKQVSSPFTVFVPVIPDGITHDFVILTNKKVRTAFFTVRTPHRGASGNRTRDLFHAMEARYQLRYSPESYVPPSQACSVGTR